MQNYKAQIQIILIAFTFVAPGLTLANTSSNPPTLKQMGTQVKTACQSDLKKFCSDVTPGQGRLAACLDSKQNRLSQECRKTWIGAKETISHRLDKAEVAFRKNCGTDVQKFCSDVPSGRGRILDCLSQHKDSLSNSCSQFEAKLDEKLSEFLG